MRATAYGSYTEVGHALPYSGTQALLYEVDC